MIVELPWQQPALPALPLWTVDLWQRLQREVGGTIGFHGLAGWTGQDAILAEAWQHAVPGAQNVAAVFGVDPDWGLAAASLRDGGSFLWLRQDPLPDPAAWRHEVETVFGGTAHLVETALDGGWHAAFGWRGEILPPEQTLDVLMVTYVGSTQMMGGSETQLFETLKALRGKGVRADVSFSRRLDPTAYALVHCYGIHHPDKYAWLSELPVPLVISPVFWDFTRTRGDTIFTIGILQHAESAADAVERLDDWYAGLLGLTPEGQALIPETPEKIDHMRVIVAHAAHVMPNGRREGEMLLGTLGLTDIPMTVVPNAVLPERFLGASPEPFQSAYGHRDFILCAGRLEPRKNQIMLIWALRDTDLPLVIVGRHSKRDYADLCRRWAGPNVHFIPELSPQMLASAYASARVHAMPSWVETPGLTNLEAALAGCNVVVGNRAIETEYFQDLAYVCDPGNWRSIRDAVTLAWQDTSTTRRDALRQRILTHFNWGQTAECTADVYRTVLTER